MDSLVSLPKFDGDNGLTAEEFDNLLMSKSIDHVWNDEETATQMCKALNGKAATWLENETKKNILIRRDLLLLRRTFLYEFGSIKTFMSVISGLKLLSNTDNFSGDAKNFSVKSFLLKVEKSALVSNWSPEEKCKHALNTLSGRAAQEIKASGDCKDWNTLKRRLIEFYGPTMSLYERIDCMRKVQGQKRSVESSEVYFARVSKTLAYITEDILKSASSSEELNGMMKMHNLFSALVFVNGIDSNIRNSFFESTIANKKDKFPSLDEVLSSVKLSEKTLKIRASQQKALDSIKEEKQAPKVVVKSTNVPVKIEPVKIAQQPILSNGIYGCFHPGMIAQPDRGRSIQRHSQIPSEANQTLDRQLVGMGNIYNQIPLHLINQSLEINGFMENQHALLYYHLSKARSGFAGLIPNQNHSRSQKDHLLLIHNLSAPFHHQLTYLNFNPIIYLSLLSTQTLH